MSGMSMEVTDVAQKTLLRLRADVWNMHNICPIFIFSEKNSIRQRA